MDKRFWSGAVIVVTVAVAGGGALPTFLLRPSAGPAPLEETFAAAAVAKVEPKAAPAPAPLAPPAPTSAAAAPAARVVSAPAALPAPRAAEQAATPSAVPAVAPASAPVAISAPSTPTPAAATDAFPPVQPVEAASGDAPPQAAAAVEKPHPMRTRRAVRKWMRLARARAARVARRNEPIRPAAYPIGEFLAFRR